MPDDVMNQVLAHRDCYSTYHHQKEQMAFAAVVLYLGAAVTAGTAKRLPWHGMESDCLIILVYLALFITAALGFVYVEWQLQMRADAEGIVRSCTEILEGRLRSETKESQAQIENLAKLLRNTGTAFHRPRVSGFLMYAAMITWTLVIVLRVACS